MSERILPEGWRWVRLKEVCEFVYGKSLPEQFRLSGNVPVYGSNGIVGYHIEALSEGPTVVIGRKGSVGAINFSNVSCWPIDTAYYVDRHATASDLKWLAYLLKSVGLSALNQEGPKPGISRENAYDIEIPLPPLDEQHRIAAILDEQMAAVEQARVAAESQLEAAKELMSAYLQEVFESEEANEWEYARLGDIAATCSGTTPSRSHHEYYEGGTIPWVKTGELKDGVIYDSEEHVTEFAMRDTSLRLLPAETLLIAMYGQGQTRGRTSLLARPATTNQACFAILPNPESFHTPFLQLWFRHSYQRLRDKTEGRGGNQPNLNGQVLNDELIPLPLPRIQKEISTHLAKKSELVEQAYGGLADRLDLTDQLPAALLRQAFSGEM